jgi:predicted nucleotidyltransferase
MTGREHNIDKLSHNYKELDDRRREALLKIGEKVFTVNNFVDREISTLVNENNEKEKIENE